ncbi:unnamed protein product, partial [Schistosoma spindalis]
MTVSSYCGRDSSAVHIHDLASRNSNPGPIGLARECLTSRPLSRHPIVLMSNFNQSTKSRHHPPLRMRSWMRITEKSHSRTKGPFSASRFFMM